MQSAGDRPFPENPEVGRDAWLIRKLTRNSSLKGHDSCRLAGSSCNAGIADGFPLNMR